MKKLRLELGEISVETFHVQDAAGEPGTVRGNQDEAGGEFAAITGWSWLCGSCNATCGDGATCPLSCAGAAPTGCNSRYCQEKLLSEINTNCHAEPATVIGEG
jgi:hypothetical protein